MRIGRRLTVEQTDMQVALRLRMRRVVQVAILLAACAGFWSPAVWAQGSRKDDIVFNSQGRPMAGATVRICTASATGQPCAPLANIYSDSALTQALANPTATDGLGNYTFYAAPGRYEIEISGPSITTEQFPNVILPNDPSTPTFASLSTTSGISAFSLSLGGNLTVNGSAAISGTLTVGGEPLPSAGQANTWLGSQTFQGPSPWVDIAAYGARAVNLNNPYWTSGTISSGSHSLAVAAVRFLNGDGISVYGAGATNSMSTPSAPTVTPSLAAHSTGVGVTAPAPAGSSSFSYKIVAIGSWSATTANNLWGAYTAASVAGTTSSGNALGYQSVSISTLSEQNCVLTVTTSSAHGLATGAYVVISGTSNDGFFGGQYIVTGSADSTHFTATIGDCTPSAHTGTGGAVGWYNVNHVTFGLPTGAFTAAVYGRTSGSWSFIGFAWPGMSDPGGHFFFDDYGSTMSGNGLAPGWLPASAPSTAQNGVLTTTVTSGGGTTALQLATAASASASGVYATVDECPAWLTAETAAWAGFSPLYVPPTSNPNGFVIGSYCPATDESGASVQIEQAGRLWLDAPMEVGTAGGWSGAVTGNTSGATSTNAPITVNTAFPGIYGNNANVFAAANLNVTASSSLQNNALLIEMVAGELASFNNVTTDTSGASGVDYMSVGEAFLSSPDITLTNDTFNGQPSEASGNGTTPQLVIQGNGQNLTLSHVNFNRRAIAAVNGNTQVHLTDKSWLQGPITPFFAFNNCNAAIGGISIRGALMDTSGQPIIANWCPSGEVFGGTAEVISPNMDAPGQVVTGTGITNLLLTDYPYPDSRGGGAVGQTFGIHGCTVTFVQNGSGVSDNPESVCEDAGPRYQAQPEPGAYFIEAAIPAPVSTLQSGGSLALGVHYYNVVANFDASHSSGGSPYGNVVTVTSGSQQISSTITAVPGAISYDWYDQTRGSITACTGITSLTCVDNGGGIRGSNGAPSAPSGGYPLMAPSGIYTPQITVGGDAQLSASPRPTTTVFLPGALTAAWTGGTWTLDKSVTVTRLQVQAKTAPAGCSTSAVVRLTDGTTPINVTVAAAANDSGSIAQNYAAAAALTVAVQTAASGCSTSPADVNVIIQYRMQ